MTRAVIITVLAVVLGTACEMDAGPPIAVSDVQAYAPLPGGAAGVAYFTVTNNASSSIAVQNVRSPQFDRIEIHESTVDGGGVSRMNRLERVDVGAGDVLRFEEGGKHLMLLGARPDTGAGSPVTFEIEHSAGLLIVNATLRNRMPGE